MLEGAFQYRIENTNQLISAVNWIRLSMAVKRKEGKRTGTAYAASIIFSRSKNIIVFVTSTLLNPTPTDSANKQRRHTEFSVRSLP